MTNAFARIAAKLFGAPEVPSDSIDDATLGDAVDAIVDVVEPRIRFLPRYRKKLAPAATHTIRFMRSLAPKLPAAIELSRAAWSTDPTINALFATADAVPVALSRSDELRKFFDGDRQTDAAYALLAMRREERNVLASAIVDGEVRRDVAQTTIGFTGHLLFAIAAETVVTRRLIGEAILERVAALALERLVAARERATELDTKRSLLATRLLMLEMKRGKLGELALDEPDPAAEFARIEKELADTVELRREAKANLATLDSSIDQIDQIFGNPEKYVGLDTLELRVNRLGYKLDERSAERGTDLLLNELWIGTRLRAVIVPVRISRAELPPEQDRFAQAARQLL